MAYIVVFTTCANKIEAENIASQLLEEKLIACANIAEGIHSMFWWNKRIDSQEEVLVMAKTEAGFFDAVCVKIKQLHSYDLPEIIAVPIMYGQKDYLTWISKTVNA